VVPRSSEKALLPVNFLGFDVAVKAAVMVYVTPRVVPPPVQDPAKS